MAMENKNPARGVSFTFFGSIVIFTGFLDTLLALKAGFQPGLFDGLFFFSGGLLLLTGRFLRGRVTS